MRDERTRIGVQVEPPRPGGLASRNARRRAAVDPAARARANAQLRQLYADVDEHQSRPWEGPGEVQCSRGCSACCRQLVLADQLEADHIVDRHFALVARLMPTLRKHAKLVDAMPGHFDDDDGERVAVRAYWEANIPCAFLTPAGECGIYVDRPMPCRTHFVTSDPALCGADAGTQIVIANFGTREPAATRLIRITAERASGGGRDAMVQPGTLPQLIVGAWDRRRRGRR